MAPKIVDKEEKQRAIALAAVEVFGEKGFERTRMEDVAQVAGVGKGTLYEYFKTKDALMDGAMGALFAGMAGDLMPSFEEGASATEMLVSLVESSVRAIKSIGFSYCFFLEYMIHLKRNNVAESLITEMLTGYRYFLADLIRQGMATGEFRKDLDPFETAASLAAWVDGAVFHWFTLPDTVSLEAMSKRFLEVTVAGLSARTD